MSHKPSLLFTACFAAIALWTSSTPAEPANRPQPQPRPVDLVIALDVSGSMSGLIESTKQRLWDIVNELAQARPHPDLRIAILTYGNPSYGQQGGYVRIDKPFTRDLDAVNQTLFGFGTNGGDEYVARAVSTAVNGLAWSTDPQAMKVLFVAGNEAADQDPAISIVAATQAATTRRIVVNTIYCGRESDRVVTGWRKVATLTNGIFASIDQNAAALANGATPMDAEIARLNQALNETYVPYGAKGGQSKKNQLAQDANTAQMSMPAVVSRAITKAGNLYRNESWDLVDAQEAGIAVEQIAPEALPEPMRSMTTDERKHYVAELGNKRNAIKKEIAELGRERRSYIAEERSKLSGGGESGLDEAILGGLRELAHKQGFEIGTTP